MQTVLLTGATGTIGKTLLPLLRKHGYKLIVLTRKPKEVQPMEGVAYAHWDVEKGQVDLDALRKADHIIHMAGAGVADKRWSEERKQEIVKSRVESTALLVRSLSLVLHKVKSFICASAIGWYGADSKRGPRQPFEENASPAPDFLGATCEAWEQSADEAAKAGLRVVKLRTGIVLSRHGGALTEFQKPINFNTAAILGSGEQMVSWIHEHDIAGLYLFALEKSIEGAYNAVAPHPVSNKELTLTLAEKMKGKAHLNIHVPAFALKLMMGEMSVEVLKSCTVSSKKVEAAGYQFKFPTIDKALEDLARKAN